MQMKAQYLNCLYMQEVVDENGIPLKSRGGKQLYRLTAPLSFYSVELGFVVTAPAGFITDLDSTPRYPSCLHADERVWRYAIGDTRLRVLKGVIHAPTV